MARGSNAGFSARVRSLTLNNRHRFGDCFFSEKEDAYKFKNFVDSKMEAIEVVDEGIMNYADSGKMC